jgi:biopolymer transport protein ExbB
MRWVIFIVVMIMVGFVSGAAAPNSAPPVATQPSGPAGVDPQKLAEAEKAAEAYLAELEKRDQAHRRAAELTAMELFHKGGVLMYPITFLSFVVLCFGLERFIGLQRRKVIPPELVSRLQNELAQPAGLNLRALNRLCQEFPSALANVVQAVLPRWGDPSVDIERALADANEREASRLYFHVRWLNLSMSVAPMLGLMGTVQGMIIVFMGATHLPPGVSRSEYMAEGIYLKLVCTFAGLCVAIPAAILSYFFEARIHKLMSNVDDFVRDLLNQLRRSGRQVASQEEPAMATAHASTP